MVGVGADVDEGGCVAVVEVDADDLASVIGRGALDVDVALALIIALVSRREKAPKSAYCLAGERGPGGG